MEELQQGEKFCQQRWVSLDFLTWLCIVVAFFGSILSAFNICTGGCTAAHEYRLFGLSFATVGILFSAVLAVLNHLRSNSQIIHGVFAMLVSSASGAELFFLHVQKVEIGQWCAVCITIATAVFVLTASIFSITLKEICMKWRFRKLVPLVIMTASFVVGLFVALAGVQQPAFAEEAGNIWFGKKNSKVEVYFISDWFCSYCRKTEPTIERIAPSVGKVAKYTFLDMPIHRETYEFIPFHLSLLVGEKRKYLQGRRALMEVASKTRKPDETVIKNAMAKHGVEFRMADFSTIMKLSNEVTSILLSNGVKVTPTVLIVNPETKEKRILSGTNQIQEPYILAAIRNLEN
ncbi:hypothetical protein A2G06_16735 (plasmid) [Geobacter anodireducens]|nr:hypothetical protein A2G06_16735 [Geobacter anodireducens]